MKSIPANQVTTELGLVPDAEYIASTATMPWHKRNPQPFQPEEFKEIGRMKLIEMYQHTQQRIHMMGHMMMNVEGIHPMTEFTVSKQGGTIMATIGKTNKNCRYKRHYFKSGQLFRHGLNGD